MNDMQFSITDLKNEAEDAPFYFDEMVDISDLAASETNDIRQMDDVQVKGFVIAEGNDFIFSFRMTGTMILPCARTLVDVVYPFEMKADEMFSLLASSTEEEEVHQVSGEMIDLTPYIKENIILQMPYRVFSDKAVLQDGAGWDFYEEADFQDRKSEAIDPRLAKLQQLMNQDKDDK